MLSDAAKRLRPQQRADLTAYPVADELVLVPPASDQVFALNQSGAAIWELCDGRHTLSDMLGELRSQFEADDIEILGDLSAALFELQSLGLLATATRFSPGRADPTAVILAPAVKERPNVHFVYGVEDRTYFHWQLAILFESMVGQLPAGWSAIVVVCNNHQPISDELRRILEKYDVLALTGESHAANHNIDFAAGGDRYVPLNRVEALAKVAHLVAPDDLVCLMDTDTFLYGELQEHLFPKGNAMAKSWIVAQEMFFHFSTKDTRGLSLPKLLEALGCENEFKPGGVTIFLTGEALQSPKLVLDCFRFLQVLYLLGKINDIPGPGVWVSEMACFAMAMIPNKIEYELVDIPQFSVPAPGVEILPEGTFFHYYADLNDGGGGPFAGSQWHKQLFRERDLLREDLASYLKNARNPVEKRFFELARRAQRRVHG